MKLEKDKLFLFVPLTVAQVSMLLFAVTLLKGWFGEQQWVIGDYCEALQRV